MKKKYHDHKSVISDADIFAKEFPLAIIGCLPSGEDRGIVHIISTIEEKDQLIFFLENTLRGLMSYVQ